MRTKVKAAARDGVALERILLSLEQELVNVADEEILAVARELGMDPAMQGSAAFAGLKFPAKPQLSDFFDLDALKRLPGAAGNIVEAEPGRPHPETPPPEDE
jgi:hypothetical protein